MGEGSAQGAASRHWDESAVVIYLEEVDRHVQLFDAFVKVSLDATPAASHCACSSKSSAQQSKVDASRLSCYSMQLFNQVSE